MRWTNMKKEGISFSEIMLLRIKSFFSYMREDLPYVIPKKIKHKCFPYDDIENEIMWLTNTDEEKEMVWLTENHVLPFEWVHVEA